MRTACSPDDFVSVDRGRIDRFPIAGRQPARGHHERRAAQVVDFGDPLAPGQPVRQFDDRPLGIAENQQVSLGIGQHRAPHLVRPVIVMSDAAQAGLDRADQHIAAGKSLAAALGIDRHGAIGPLVGLGIRGIGVVGTALAVGSVAIDHRIHVAGGHAEKQVRFSQFSEVDRGIPVGLADDADPETLRFEQAADQRHPETRMIDIGVAGDENDVAGIPAQRVHFGTRHRQEGRRTETRGPELAMAEERPGNLRNRIHGVFYPSP